MGTSSSLGNLAVLPRETRDHIYGYVISDRYRAYYSDSIVNDYDCDQSWILWGMYDKLGVIGTSRVAGAEASQVLYNTARFCFQQSGGGSPVLQGPPNIKIIERIMNIDLFVFVESICNYTETRLTDRMDPGPLTLFEGSKIPRKSAIIRVVSTSERPFGGALLRTPLFSAVRGLVGFKSVILKAAYERTLQRSLILSLNSAYGSLANTTDEGFFAGEPIQHFLFTAKTLLEPYLGPSSDISKLVSPSGSSFWKDGCRQIEFFPREYMTNAMKIGEETTVSNRRT